MKIGISYDNNVMEKDMDTYFEKLHKQGYSCLDFNMCDTDTWIYTEETEEAERRLSYIREQIQSAGLTVSQTHGPWRCPPVDYTEEHRAERMEKMKRSIWAATVLGCKNWVIHPIMPCYENSWDAEDPQKTWDMNIVFMKELLETAKEYDIVICLENMPFPEFSMSAPDDILRFVQAMDDDHFKICLDTGHAAVMGWSPAEAVRESGSEIRVLHVHDNDGRQDLHLMPYSGVIDWEDFGKALAQIHYSGVFSLEMSPSRKLSEYLQDEMRILLANIAGHIGREVE